MKLESYYGSERRNGDTSSQLVDRWQNDVLELRIIWVF